MNYDIIIIGGGAAGFFTAIQCAEHNPNLNILILEKTQKVLSKVKISGGGRCNVTHGCFDPRDLISYYPRGGKALLGPFHKFMCGDMMGWLEDHGVETKIEDDGRVFPISNDSQSIIDCFLDTAQRYKIQVKRGVQLNDFSRMGDTWELSTNEGDFDTNSVVFTTGSNRHIWDLLKEKGHDIITPVPSLFTFRIKDSLLDDLMGLAIQNGVVKVQGTKLEETGPILITHWGLSGPGILKISARGARELSLMNYNFNINVNWTSESTNDILKVLENNRVEFPRKSISKTPQFGIPSRLWKRHVELCDIAHKNWADLSKKESIKLAENLSNYTMKVTAKSTNKDEFVTAGGINLKEVNFKNMQSKILPNIYFAGEILDIDALTGGFNFQAAWTTSYLVGQVFMEK